MQKIRRGNPIALFIGLVVCGIAVYQLVQFQRAFGVKDQRVVQILESQDRALRAELIRKYEFLDLNFILRLNGETIYTSPDFRQSYKIPFRETILWDTTGKNLIFEVGGHRLFGYDVIAHKKLSDKQLLSLRIRTPRPEDFGYSGSWPDDESR